MINRIKKKIKKRGLTGLFFAFVNKPFSLYRRYKTNKDLLNSLAKDNFSVVFKHECDTRVHLPRLSRKDIFSDKGRELLSKCIKYRNRSNSEPLLRRIVYQLYKNNLIDKKLSVIDIGCWLADNTIVWANFLDKEKADILAIDPAESNIAFGKLLADMNKCSNIKWYQAVCGDIEGIPLYYENRIDHATFNAEEIGTPSHIKTTTLDSIVGKDRYSSIGLLHIDVEGFEKKVLKGAENIIKYSKPIIIFEQHICKEDSVSICKELVKESYAVYMINEVLPGCEKDCRNFIAIQNNIDISKILNVEVTKGREQGIWYAVNGNSIIPYTINY